MQLIYKILGSAYVLDDGGGVCATGDPAFRS